MKPLASSPAFSLTEVVIALGIVTFTLVAILGLMGVGINASRQSSDDTVLAAMTSYVLGELRGSGAMSNSFFFDQGGAPLGNGTNAIYRCEAAPSAPEISGLSTNFRKVRLVFTWPASAPASASTNVINASILYP